MRKKPFLLHNLTIILIGLLATTIQAQPLHIATYNIRNENQDDVKNGNGWQQRGPVITSLIRFHDFDIFGTQEVKIHQLHDLEKGLPGYAHIGIGRDDGKEAGEFSAIFYKTDRFTLLKTGNFWLAENTELPAKGWDAALPRICSWGKFKDKQSGKDFFFFNTHFDHIGIKARSESAKLIISKIKELANDDPFVLTGDFNVDQHNEIYQIFTQSGILSDAYEITAIRYALNGTFNNFDNNTLTDSRIDHIFLSKQFRVGRYGILTDSYRSAEGSNGEHYTSGNFPKEVSFKVQQARLPSDHFPVMITAEIH